MKEERKGYAHEEKGVLPSRRKNTSEKNEGNYACGEKEQQTKRQ